ncbi:phospholipase D family protein [Nakamurella sp. A5-74]|uniref:Phospholipase D family protein n=1 Tax=Nakamurella sp. A5-74 TaxID=3158264 RepID=A0AAU8DQR0_9ACTN
MLAPDDRQLLLSHLQPPPGLRLRHAVGTTFTLDLEAALLAPLAAATRILNDASKRHPIAILEALRSSVDKIDIFFQNGYLAAPAAYAKLNAFLERSLHPVRPPKPGYLFHPKVWMLEFSSLDDDEPMKYRLIVATRNLTSSVSWDVMVALDGEPGTRPLASNRPLAALIRALPGLAHDTLQPERAARIATLAEAVRRINWDQTVGVDELAFHAFGIDGEPVNPDFSGSKGLIISPFVSLRGLERVAADMKTLDVVSRTDQLAQILPADLDALQAQLFVVRPDAGLNPEETGSDPTPDPEDQDQVAATAPGVLLDGLHAKIIVTERASKAHFFTGSLNTTDNAFTGNVEFLLEIVGARKEYGVDAILHKDGMGGILEPFARPDVEPAAADEQDLALDAELSRLTELHLACTLTGARDRIRAEITSAEPVALDAAFTAKLSMAGVNGRSIALLGGEAVAGHIPGLSVEDVTSWAVLTVEDHRSQTRTTLVKMRLIGDDSERLDAVMASQIDSTEKFLALLRLLLAEDADSITQELGADMDGSGFFEFGQMLGQGLFEGLVRGLAAKPEALHTITDLIEQLRKRGAEDVIPPGLLELWPAFLEAGARLEGARS